MRRVDAKHWLAAGLVSYVLWGAWHAWESRAAHPPDGAIAPEEPLQGEPLQAAPVPHGRWQLTPRASYDITARVLSREDYRYDGLADLVREDLALGWGPMSDNRVLAAFEISQGARYYSWRARRPPPIPLAEVVSHSANTHVIARDGSVAAVLTRIRPGQVVHLVGELVDGVRSDGTTVHTSLSRSDSGAGACEVLLVERAEIL
jgi:hypothetical protein